MLAERAVINSGPLLALSLAGRLDLLPALFNEFWIPDLVFNEVTVAGLGRPGADDLSGKNQALIAPMQVLGQNTTHRFLVTMISTEAIGLLSPAWMDDSHQAVSDTYGLD